MKDKATRDIIKNELWKYGPNDTKYKLKERCKVMKKKSIVSFMLALSLMLGAITGCGQGSSEPAAVDGDGGSNPAEAEGGDTEAAGETADAKSGSDEATAEGVVGEWAYMCSIYHSDDDDGEYEYVTMTSDESAPNSGLTIRQDGERYTLDYFYQLYESEKVYYGIELSHGDGAPYEGAEDQSGYYEFSSPVSNENETVPYHIYMQDEETLVVCYEYSSEPTDEYRYHTVNKDLYLRKDSPRFDDMEALRYFDTVTVSNMSELLGSLQNNRKIILKEGDYNFSHIAGRDLDNSHIDDSVDGVSFTGLYNICFEAEKGADVRFLVDDAYVPVFKMESGGNFTLRGITVGHNVEPGYCTGSVLAFKSMEGVDVDKCDLYGSGTYGIEAESTYRMNVTDTDIHDCTYGLVYLKNCGLSNFKNCKMKDSRELSMINCYSCYETVFEDCEFSNNVANAYDSCYFVELGEYDSVTFRGCAFNNNTFNVFSNSEVTLENCTANDNNTDVTDLFENGGRGVVYKKEDIVSAYEAAQNRSAEIDNELQTNTFLDQTSLNNYANEEYDLWDSLLNQMWSYLQDNLDAAEMERLSNEEHDWIAEKEKAMKDSIKGFEGGTMQPMVEFGTGADVTKKRVEELFGRYFK